MPTFAIDALRPWGEQAYVAAGMKPEDAATVVENQLWSDLRGVDTHGFQRVSWYVNWFQDGSTNPKAELEIVHRTPSLIVGDGHSGLGQLVVTRFMEELIESAREPGLMIGLLRGSNDWGCGANYPYHAAQAGFICFGTTTSVPNLAPFGSRRRLFGNNPVVYAFPRRNAAPIVLDMALTPVALGKVMRARAEKSEIPLEWGFRDRDGEPTVDPETALRGIIPAIGGYKGIGLAVVSNLLAGVLTGSQHTGGVEIGKRGQFFLLLDPALAGDADGYFDAVEDMVQQMRDANEDVLPAERVYLPGEIEQTTFEERRARGRVSYPDSVVRSLEKIGDEIGVPFTVTPFPEGDS